MGKLDCKTAIITGASVGVGRGIAMAMAKQGADICICARNNEKLQRTAEEIRTTGAKVLACQCDVMKYDDLEKLVHDTVETFGRIDILVNNAATIPMGVPFEETTPEIFNTLIKSGLESTFHMMQLCFPHLKKKGGKIINMSSAAGARGKSGLCAYAAAKEGIGGMTRVAAIEWAEFNINVNSISPFALSEAMQGYLAQLPEQVRKDPAKQIAALGLKMPAIQYIGDAEKDIGPVAVFLASADANYITGHVLPVDGGMTDLGV